MASGGFDDSQELQVELQEDFDPDYEPTREDIEDYAEVIGLDLNTDPDLEWIAREGLSAPLPHGWKPCKDMVNNEVYYFNFNTGESIWDHPCDTKYRDIYLEEKAKKTQKLAKAQSGGGKAATSGSDRWKKKGASKKKESTSSPSAVAARPGTSHGTGGMQRPKTAGRGPVSFDDDPPVAAGETSPEVMKMDVGESSNSVLASMGVIDIADLRKQQATPKSTVMGTLDADFDEKSDDEVPYDEVLQSSRGSANFGLHDVGRGRSQESEDDSFETMRREQKESSRSPVKKPSGSRSSSRVLSPENERRRVEEEARLAEAREEAERHANHQLQEERQRLARQHDEEIQRLKREHTDEKTRLAKEHKDELAKIATERKGQLSKAASDHEKEVARLLKERETEISEATSLAEGAAKRRQEAAANAEADLTALEAEYAVKKKKVQQKHDADLADATKHLSDERAKELEKHQASHKSELEEMTKKHAVELERRKTELKLAHKEALDGLETEAKKLEAASARQKELDREIAQKRAELESALETELAKKRKDYEAKLSDELSQLDKAHRSKKEDLRQKYRREEREDEERLRSAATANRERIQKEEEAKLKELQSEVLALNDAVDEERRQLNADLDTLKDNHREHTRDLEAELQRAQELKAEMAANEATLEECTREVKELEKRRDLVREQLLAEEQRVAECVEKSAAAPTASALSLDDLETGTKPAANKKPPQNRPRGKRKVRINLENDENGSESESGSSDASPASDSEGSDDPLGAVSEALYLQRAKDFLATNGSESSRYGSTMEQGHVMAAVHAVLDESSDDLDDDDLEGDYLLSRGRRHVGPYRRNPGLGEAAGIRSSAQASVVAAEGRARSAIDHWTHDHLAATQALQGHSAWLSSFRESLRASRKAHVGTAGPGHNPYSAPMRSEHPLNPRKPPPFPQLAVGADGHIRLG